MYMLHGTPTRKELQKAGDNLISWTKPLPNKKSTNSQKEAY